MRQRIQPSGPCSENPEVLTVSGKRQSTQAKPRGGRRPGAGRPLAYTLMERMAILYRVAEFQKEFNLPTRASAIRALQKRGELPSGIKNLARYITPARLDPRVIEALADTPGRIGILSLIPLPEKSRSRKPRD